MKKLLFRILLLGLLSCPSLAMDDEESWKILDLRIFTQAILIDIEDLLSLNQVNQAWHEETSSESFWKAVYFRLKGNTVKLHDELTFKGNYLKHALPTVCFHVTNNIPLVIRDDFIHRNRVTFEEICTWGSMANEDFMEMVLNALNKKPRVFCTCFWVVNDLNELFSHALSYDVLMIVPGGNTASTYGEDLAADFHMKYPNVIWTAACKQDGTLKPFSNIGQLPEVAAPSLYNGEGTSASALNIGELVCQLRALRPDLTAAEIRSLLVASADRTQESEQKIPLGGILNRQAAIKAALEYLKDSANQ